MTQNTTKTLGVIIVTYGSSDVILDCLRSLEESQYPNLKIVVCDNASKDDTCDLVSGFAVDNKIEFSTIAPEEYGRALTTNPKRLTLITSSDNLGYAGGVNMGLNYLTKCPDVDYFWILNPDSEVLPDTAGAYVEGILRTGDFGLITGRTLYYGEDGMIQSDGGYVNLWTGVCRNINQGQMQDQVSMPDAGSVNFLSGANFIASRRFVDRVGNMKDDYFLYYEEVDWALRRGDLPLVLCPKSIVLHHGGTAIGSGTTRRIPSGFSNYFNYRNRIIFMRRFNPIGVPIAYGYSLLKILQLLLKGARTEAYGAWKGLNLMRPPADVEARVDQRARRFAFPKKFSR